MIPGPEDPAAALAAVVALRRLADRLEQAAVGPGARRGMDLGSGRRGARDHPAGGPQAACTPTPMKAKTEKMGLKSPVRDIRTINRLLGGAEAEARRKRRVAAGRRAPAAGGARSPGRIGAARLRACRRRPRPAGGRDRGPARRRPEPRSGSSAPADSALDASSRRRGRRSGRLPQQRLRQERVPGGIRAGPVEAVRPHLPAPMSWQRSPRWSTAPRCARYASWALTAQPSPSPRARRPARSGASGLGSALVDARQRLGDADRLVAALALERALDRDLRAAGDRLERA